MTCDCDCNIESYEDDAHWEGYKEAKGEHEDFVEELRKLLETRKQDSPSCELLVNDILKFLDKELE